MKKRQYSSEFKVKIVLEVMRGERTLSEIAAANGLNPNQIGNWKREFSENAHRAFDTTKTERETRSKDRENAEKEAQMLKTIGQLTMERDFLKAVTEHTKDRGLL
jgi:transposase-like protein